MYVSVFQLKKKTGNALWKETSVIFEQMLTPYPEGAVTQPAYQALSLCQSLGTWQAFLRSRPSSGWIEYPPFKTRLLQEVFPQQFNGQDYE